MTEPTRLPRGRRVFRRALVGILTLLAGGHAHAVEATWSGFATLGYASSDSPYTYQRFVNEDGSFKRDTLAAAQVDLRLNAQWSATAQLKLATADDSNSRISLTSAWAFLAWRPNNDWLVRAGKSRLPLYMYSESLDVGVSHDMAHLPHEVYSIAPTNDFNGVYVTHSLVSGDQELSLEVYGGETVATAHLWSRDGVPPVVPAGPVFKRVEIKVLGTVLLGRDPDLSWRLGLMTAQTRQANGQPLPKRYPRVEVGPGLAYWKVSDQQPGPEIEQVDAIRNLALTAGIEWQFDPTWRVAAEFVRMRQFDTELGSDSTAGYIAAFKKFGAFTPYVSLSRKRSSAGILETYRRLTQEQLPDFIPGAQQTNLAQRLAAESLYAFDQRTWALGASYALTANAKIKAEWARTEIGAASADFGAPAGKPDPQNMRVNTLTVNLSVAF